MDVLGGESVAEPPEGPVRATDGMATADELSRRRTARAGSIEERAADVGVESDGQLFVWEQGRKVSLASLVARNVPVEHAFVFGMKRLKGRGGLMSFDDDVVVISRGKVGSTRIVPTRDEDEAVTKVVIETHIAAKVVAPADSLDGIALIENVLARRGFSRSAEIDTDGA